MRLTICLMCRVGALAPLGGNMALKYDDVLCPYCGGLMYLSSAGDDDTKWRAKFICPSCLIHSPSHQASSRKDAEWFAYKKAKEVKHLYD